MFHLLGLLESYKAVRMDLHRKILMPLLTIHTDLIVWSVALGNKREANAIRTSVIMGVANPRARASSRSNRCLLKRAKACIA